ncbi:MAG: hydrogenase 3 maturation protease [Archaeoglobi archaeon]|nr:hydrogenase 3 maturation protease [Archaeoglobi archaeon]MDK2781069.1 hydrogenase 3 maturation protease [Archaeoglobi archaeon]
MEKLEKELRRALEGRVAIIGVGNPVRGDDGFGSIFVRALKRKFSSERVLLIDAEIMPENYTGKIRNFKPERILIVDSTDFGGSPGDLVMFEEGSIRGVLTSTHKIPLSALASYLRKETGAEIFFLGVQPKRSEIGDKMSEEVAGVMKELVKLFITLLSEPAPFREDR